MSRPLLRLALGIMVLSTASASAADAPPTFSGNYLAGVVARKANDDARASEAFRRALDLTDGKNQKLLDVSMLADAMLGRWETAVPLAARLIAISPSDNMANLIASLDHFKAGRYQECESAFKTQKSLIGTLISSLALAWTAVARGAPASLPPLEAGAEEYKKTFYAYHRGLLADLAKKPEEAEAAFKDIIAQRVVRFTLAYARHAINAGDFAAAGEALDKQLAKSNHPLVQELRTAATAKRTTDLLVTTPSEGLAEVFYGIGEALISEEAWQLGTVYLQLALRLEPQHQFALASLANAQERRKLPAEAIATYEKIVSGTPLQPLIEQRKAYNLDALGKADEAKALLLRESANSPGDRAPLQALGDIMRGRKRFEEAVDAYTKAIKLTPEPTSEHWQLFYARGTAYERLDKWSSAEPDLKKALELSPNQANILNYLGYSWVDKNINVAEGIALIEKAVALMPDDAFIVDSLGWAHFKRGVYPKALELLNRAVTLNSEDAALSDHLGDALWKTGSKVQAKQLWTFAATISTEADEKAKLSAKALRGLSE